MTKPKDDGIDATQKVIRERRIEAAKWPRLRGWLDVEEWTPATAAYLFVGLDPDTTEAAAGTQDWAFSWLPGYPESGASKDGFSLARNTEIEIQRMMRLVAAANPLAVRTPRQWIAWAEKHKLAPAWLALARCNPRMSGLSSEPRHRAPRKRRKALSIPEVMAWLKPFQREYFKLHGAPAKAEHMEKECRDAINCDRNSFDAALKYAVETGWAVAQGSPGRREWTPPQTD